MKRKSEGKFDAPFNVYSGSAYLFGKTSGVTESVVRYVYSLNKLAYNKSVIQTFLLWETADKTQNIKVFEFKLNQDKFRAIVVHGGAAVQEMMTIYNAGKLKGVDVVEVMMCCNGCIGGGG